MGVDWALKQGTVWENGKILFPQNTIRQCADDSHIMPKMFYVTH